MIDEQVLYQGRWVSRLHFRVFVYNSEGQKLANSYDEYSALISSGVWFSEKPSTVVELPESIEIPEIEDDNNIVAIKAKRGRKCLNQHKV